MRTRDTLDITEDLNRLSVPARIVWGTADRFQKLQYGERLAWDLDAELTRVEGGKHWVPEDHPDAVADALNRLVAEVT